MLGLAYAVAWFGAADRAGVTHPLSAVFHGLAAVVISLPLIWEASAHFRLLSPATSAATLLLISGLAVGVAWHRYLQSLAGVAVLGSIVAAGGLVVATGRPLPFAAALVALGACTLWLSDARGWSWLRWYPALAADLMAVVLVGRAVVVPPQEPPGEVIALLLALVAVYLGSVAWRTLVADERVQVFDMIQAPCAVGIGLVGALIVARGGPGPALLTIGGLGLLGAAAGYVAAFGVLRQRSDARANVVFFSTMAVGLLLIGSGAILSGPALVAWCGGLAVLQPFLAGAWPSRSCRCRPPSWDSPWLSPRGRSSGRQTSGSLAAPGCPCLRRMSRPWSLPRRAWPCRRKSRRPLPPAGRRSSPAWRGSSSVSCSSSAAGASRYGGLAR